MPFSGCILGMAQNSETHINIPCADLDTAIEYFTHDLGFRLDMIAPADAPRIAQLSGHGVTLRLEKTLDGGAPARHGNPYPPAAPEPPGPLSAAARIMQRGRGWHDGRAGMQYRDLIPDRLRGRVIASQIRIPHGGAVADYVHYHEVAFQMIYCRRGWVRVVYEDQGPDFVMHAGDCVLQAPRIRHRVLEASPGLEVIEIGCPAEHETWREHDLHLPTDQLRPDRDFSGQRFVRHVAADANWRALTSTGFDYRDTGIATATGGLAGAGVLRSGEPGRVTRTCHTGETLLIGLDGRCTIRTADSGGLALGVDAVCVLPPQKDCEIVHDTDDTLQILEIELPADVSLPQTDR